MDANVLFDLRELNALHLLNQIFSDIIIPLDTITVEVDADTLLSLDNITYVTASITTQKGYQVYARCHSRKGLSHCDKMAIALAAENKFLLCTNEGPARKQAKFAGIEVSGTLGIIAAAHLNGIIDKEEARDYLLYLANQGSCYLSETLVREVLEDLGIEI